MSPDPTRRKPRVQTINELPSKTVQGEAHRSEIRAILAKYKATGVVDHLRDVDLQFRDVSEFEDFADLMRQSSEAEAAFMRLPSKLREVFDHDHHVWLDYAHSPERLEELRPQLENLGIMEPLPPPPPPPPHPLAPRSLWCNLCVRYGSLVFSGLSRQAGASSERRSAVW